MSDDWLKTLVDAYAPNKQQPGRLLPVDGGRHDDGASRLNHGTVQAFRRAASEVRGDTVITDPNAASTPLQMHSRGKVFNILACPEMWHPSWWSFLDELETREQWWHIEPGQVVLDVGADYGSYTLSALAQGASLVWAWSPPFKEPSRPVEAMTMAKSIDANGWASRVKLCTSGLWRDEGWLAAFDGPRMAQFFKTQSEALACIEGQDGHCATFPVAPLDAYGIQRVDWVKIDAEGAELAILEGGRETIKRWRPNILFENHVHLDPDCEARCRTFLEELGYFHVGTRPHHSISHTLMKPGPVLR